LCRNAPELIGRTPKVYIHNDDEKYPPGIPLPPTKDMVGFPTKYFSINTGEPKDRAFPTPPRNVDAEIMRHDLKPAGVPLRKEKGLVYDFHSIRGQLATDIAHTGIPLRKIQKAMLHSDIKLTMHYYTHLTTKDQKILEIEGQR